MTAPIRQREDNFRRFETSIALAFGKFPNAHTFVPVGMAPETVVNRMRDAINSFLKPLNTWTSEHFNKAELLVWWNQIVISHDGEAVRIGPPIPKTAKALEGTTVIEPSSTSSQEHIVERPSDMDLRCLIFLISRGILTETFRCKFPDPGIAADILERQAIPVNVEAFLDDSDIILL